VYTNTIKGQEGKAFSKNLVRREIEGDVIMGLLESAKKKNL